MGETFDVPSTPRLRGGEGDDAGALDRIAALMDGREWDDETLEHVAEILRASGRQVREPFGPDRCPRCGSGLMRVAWSQGVPVMGCATLARIGAH